MTKTKVFDCGGSQAVRVPKEFRFTENEVVINKVGSVVVLLPKSNPWAGFLSSPDRFSDDFMADRQTENRMRESETS